MKNKLCLIGLNYKTAPVEIREAFALTSSDELEQEIFTLNDHVHEIMVLSTCNRVEILAVVNDSTAKDYLLQQWATLACKDTSDLLPYVYEHWGQEAITHLFSVASSLDSMILGEAQILGQLKEAYRNAIQLDQAKVVLTRLLHKSFSVAKRVRSETAIASSAVSISYAAIELAKRIFDDMSEVRALLIGAGEMAELAATYLMGAGIASISVANRTLSRAEELANSYSGKAVPFDNLIDSLVESDIIISSTAANEPIIHANDILNILRKRKNRPMFFIDIAVPRDIDPTVNTLDNVYLYDIDDLKDVVEENLAQRQEEAIKAQRIVDDETQHFLRWLKSLDLQPTIVNLIEKTEDICKTELEKTCRRLGTVDAKTEEALNTMISSIVKKISHDPISFLKRHLEENDKTTANIHFIRRIFNLDNDFIPENAHPAGKDCGRKRDHTPKTPDASER